MEACLPAEHLRIRLRVTGETEREAVVEAQGARYEQVLTQTAGQPSAAP